MPIEIENLASDIFVLRWKGAITLQEVQASHDKTVEIARTAGISRYTHILIMTEVKAVPLEPIGLWEVLFRHPEVKAVLVVDANNIVRRLTNMLNALTRTVTLEPFPTLESAQARAVELLENAPVHAKTTQ